MEYQLVLQFRGDSLAELDAAAELEDELGETLGDKGDVDGHDIGSGETNIFIFTSDPGGSFALAKPILDKGDLLKSLTAAYHRCRWRRLHDYLACWFKR